MIFVHIVIRVSGWCIHGAGEGQCSSSLFHNLVLQAPHTLPVTSRPWSTCKPPNSLVPQDEFWCSCLLLGPYKNGVDIVYISPEKEFFPYLSNATLILTVCVFLSPTSHARLSGLQSLDSGTLGTGNKTVGDHWAQIIPSCTLLPSSLHSAYIRSRISHRDHREPRLWRWNGRTPGKFGNPYRFAFSSTQHSSKLHCLLPGRAGSPWFWVYAAPAPQFPAHTIVDGNPHGWMTLPGSSLIWTTQLKCKEPAWKSQLFCKMAIFYSHQAAEWWPLSKLTIDQKNKSVFPARCYYTSEPF